MKVGTLQDGCGAKADCPESCSSELRDLHDAAVASLFSHIKFKNVGYNFKRQIIKCRLT